MKRIILILFIFLPFVFARCKKDTPDEPQCADNGYVPPQPYSYPVWHPSGQFVGFNWTPLTGIYRTGTGPCDGYYHTSNRDSTGFYIMNRNGTGLKRITNYKIYTPAWSPDGNWLAFHIGGQIYKMCFNGTDFDTAHIVQLTSQGSNFFPSWTGDNDSIYYDSNFGTNGQGYFVWKMASDGSGSTGFPNTGRDPFVASNGLVYYVRGASGSPEIFSMNKDGSNQIQVTNNGNNTSKTELRYFGGNLFYSNGSFLKRYNLLTGQETQIASPCATYDISPGGEIVYSKYMDSTYSPRIGTLWIMNTDGTNKRQFTFNNL